MYKYSHIPSFSFFPIQGYILPFTLLHMCSILINYKNHTIEGKESSLFFDILKIQLVYEQIYYAF